MKNSRQRQAEWPLYTRVLMMMLEKGISRRTIMHRLRMSKSLLSKALSGKRLLALKRVAAFVQSYERPEHWAR
jgi:hypothetical protein